MIDLRDAVRDLHCSHDELVSHRQYLSGTGAKGVEAKVSQVLLLAPKAWKARQADDIVS